MRALLSCSALLLSALPLTAAADEPAPPKRRYETVVTGSRDEESVFESPRALQVVGRDRIADSSAATTPEALEEADAVYVQRTNSAGGAPILRGMIGQHVLLLIDGIRLNNAITRHGPNQLLNTVDPFQLERIEVLRGPGSVQHGSDALGGVINLISRKPRFDPWRAWDLQGGGIARFESAAEGLVTNAAVEGHVRQFGLRIGGTFRRFDDLVGGRLTGRQPFTAYWEGDTDISAAWYIGRHSELRLGYAAVRQQDAPRTDRSAARDFRIFSDQLRDLVALRYVGRYDRFFIRRIDATLSYQSHRELNERFRLDRDTIERGRDDVGSLGLNVALRTDLPYNRLSYGLDLYYDSVSSTAEEELISEPIRTPLTRGRYLDGSGYLQLGAFVLDRVSLLSNKLYFDIGGRVSSWVADIPADPVNLASDYRATQTGVVGSAHVRYLFGDGLAVSAGIGQGFRAPNIDDFTALGCTGQGYDIPNPKLGPEKSLTAEAGVKLDLFGKLRGSAHYYFTYLDDMIVRRALVGTARSCGGSAPVPETKRQNAQRGMIHGVEARLSLELGRRWSLFSALAWTWGEVRVDDRDEPLGRIPPLFGMAGLRYEQERSWFAELSVRWAARQSRLSSGDLVDLRVCPDGAAGCSGTPGYAVIRLRGAVRIIDQLRVTAALDNFTNETYRVHGSGVDGPGIDAILGLELLVK